MPRPKKETTVERTRPGMVRVSFYNVEAKAWTELKVLAILQGLQIGEAATRAFNLYAEHIHNGGKKSKRRTN